MRHVCLLAGWLTDWMGECLIVKGETNEWRGEPSPLLPPEWEEEQYYNFDTYKLDTYIFIYSFWLRWVFLGLPRWCSGKESACQCRRHKRRGFNNLGQEDPLEEDRVTHSNILAWRIPWTEELLTARLRRVTSQTWLSGWALTHTRYEVWRHTHEMEMTLNHETVAFWWVGGLTAQTQASSVCRSSSLVLRPSAHFPPSVRSCCSNANENQLLLLPRRKLKIWICV